jgi:hypothetical protein
MRSPSTSKSVSGRRGSPVLLTLATVLGLWFGLNAPDVSPVAPPIPVLQTQQPALMVTNGLPDLAGQQ